MKSIYQKSAVLLTVVLFAVLSVIGFRQSEQPVSVSSHMADGSKVDSYSEVDTNDLADHCRRRAASICFRLGDGWDVREATPFVILYHQQQAEHVEVWQFNVERMFNEWKARYLRATINSPIVVVCCRSDEEFAQARKLAVVASNSPKGFYDPNIQLIVCNVADGLDSLRHELVHAMIDADYPSCPLWLSEGMACLFEAGAWGDDQFIPQLSWRMNVTIPLPLSADRVQRFTQRRTQTEASDYAQAYRYCLQLAESGKLAVTYQKLRNASD